MLAEGEEIPKIERYIISERKDNDFTFTFTPASSYYIYAGARQHQQQHQNGHSPRPQLHLFYAVHVRGKTNCVELWYPSMLLGNLLSSVRESPITEVVAPIDSSSLNWCFTPSRVKHPIIYTKTPFVVI